MPPRSPRRRARRLPGVVAVLAVVAAACTPSRSPGPSTADPGAAAVKVAEAWLAKQADLDPGVVGSLVAAETVTTPGARHVRFDQVVDGHRVRGSRVVVHVLDDRSVQGASVHVATGTPVGAGMTITEARAVEAATKAVEGDLIAEPTAELVWIPNGDVLLPAWLVTLATKNPYATWQITIDGVDGVLLGGERSALGVVGRRPDPARMGGTLAVPAGRAGPTGDGTPDRCPLTAAPSACVFAPDPATAAGGRVDPSVANDLLVPVTLEGLSQPDQLRGDHVDAAAPGDPNPPPPEPDGRWGAGVGSRSFEAAMAYHWVDTTQRLLGRLGFSVRADAPTVVRAMVPEVVDNAFYDFVADAVFLGVGTNGIAAGQDAAVIIHEYGHALLGTQIGFEAHQGHEVSAYSEAFGDLLAALVTIGDRPVDPACFGSWFVATNGCLRRLDRDLVYPGDLRFEVHDDGELFAGAVWEIFEGLLGRRGLRPGDCRTDPACLEVRDRLLTVIMSAHAYIVPASGFADIARAYLLANDAAYDGVDRDVFEAAFASRGLLVDAPTGMDAGGGRTDGRRVGVALDIRHDYRGDLRVTVGVVDPGGRALCEPVTVLEPDPDDDADNVTGVVDLTGTGCAGLTPPSAERIWFVLVADELADDEGQVLEVAVLDGDDAYPAGGLPTPVPDADPAGVVVLVDGTARRDGEQPGPAPGDPVVRWAVDHGYHGDLFIRAGVADATGTVVCSVPVREPDALDDTAGPLEGTVGMAACADRYPPAPDRRWFLQVIDTAARDTGTVTAFALEGPDGTTFRFDDVPVEVPDADDDGVALLLDGTTGTNGTAGGAGRRSSMGLPAAAVRIEHPYSGDLAVAVGVADPDLNILCEVPLVTADPGRDTPDIDVEASVADCGHLWPPDPGRLWYVFVRDTLDEDTGRLVEASLTGPDGAVLTSPDVPVDIPDADLEGVAVIFDGDETGGDGTITASVVISHPYVGDLLVTVGVADPATGDVACEIVVAEPDPDNDTVDLQATVDMTACADLWPPAPDRAWYVSAFDTAAFDTGTIDVLVLIGPDGSVRRTTIGPVPIPDDDPVGASLFFTE